MLLWMFLFIPSVLLVFASDIFFNFLKVLFFIYYLRERVHVCTRARQGGGRKREREREREGENPKQALCCQCGAQPGALSHGCEIMT